MILLNVENVAKAFGGHEVLQDVSLTLQNGMRMGLVGVNGCGKSTLLRILAGKEMPDQGKVELPKGVTLGFLEQINRAAPDRTVREELSSVFEPLREMEVRLRKMEADMAQAEGEEAEKLYESYDRLLHRFEEADGYSWSSRVEGVLSGLGFDERMREQKAELLSGGELTRLFLGKLLLQSPDILLLDEPTNHLDLNSLNWLEKYLSDYPGTVLVVSHDRFFLDRVCTDITEILLGRSEQYSGNYSVYMSQRTARFESRMKAWETQQKEIRRQEAIIERYKSFNREKSIRAARSKQKRLDKVERLEKPEDDRQICFSFTAGRRTGEDVLITENLCKSFDGKELFEGLNLHVRAGERVAVVGPNGCGKSTLLNILMGQLSQDRGSYRWGANTDVGYYDQHQRSLHPEKTVLDEVWDRFPRMEQYEVRGALGQFLFTGEEVFEKISTLSGGEKGRVALTELMLRKDNVLLLDEPTNHLDMDSREVLEDALEDFEGTILAVSHDRYFINRFADHVAVLSHDGIKEYNGNWDDYQQELLKEKCGDEDPALQGLTRTQQDKLKKQKKQEEEKLRQLKQQLRQAEETVQRTEELLSQKEQELASPNVYGDPQKASRLSNEYKKLQESLSKAYSAWEEAEEKLNAALEDRVQEG